ncbi:elastin-like isoform X2 [Frankliniella occidentalis]|uniref:Elastin-like isoform X2 n=1 Tax=Frankliniella occidentalis TaxID=133901 RepID=A0A6J1SSU1_FRAOC|nr:elastin-like isoform X2 [Frankliniella occidentalis]
MARVLHRAGRERAALTGPPVLLLPAQRSAAAAQVAGRHKPSPKAVKLFEGNINTRTFEDSGGGGNRRRGAAEARATPSAGGPEGAGSTAGSASPQSLHSNGIAERRGIMDGLSQTYSAIKETVVHGVEVLGTALVNKAGRVGKGIKVALDVDSAGNVRHAAGAGTAPGASPGGISGTAPSATPGATPVNAPGAGPGAAPGAGPEGNPPMTAPQDQNLDGEQNVNSNINHMNAERAWRYQQMSAADNVAASSKQGGRSLR